MNDILTFAVRTLVTDGRLCMWMPANSDEEIEISVPMHQNLEVLSTSVQPFNNCEHHLSSFESKCLTLSPGSRRLITYRRLPEGVLSDVSSKRQKGDASGVSADELNAFRRTVSPSSILSRTC